MFEEFLGVCYMYVPSIDFSTLTKVAKDVLLRYNISLSKLRHQCYSGTSAVQKVRSGVATRFLEQEFCALYTHCYGHSINLAASDAIKHTKEIKHVMEMGHNITKLLNYLPH